LQAGAKVSEIAHVSEDSVVTLIDAAAKLQACRSAAAAQFNRLLAAPR
jgi:hypothetical protein